MIDYLSFAISISLIQYNWGYLNETLCLEKLFINNLDFKSFIELSFIHD